MPDVTAEPGSQHDRTPTQAALRLLNAGRADDAITLLARFLAENPEDVPALALLSLAQLRAQRWDEALLAADQAIGLAPTYWPAWQRRGIALIELDRPADAEAAATEYLRLAPDDWHAHYTMARVLRSVRGRRQQAMRHALHAVELAPDEADAHNLLGVICRSLEDRAGAELAYRAALAVDPAHALARSNLALLTLGQGGTEAVMAGLREAAASDPQQGAIHRNMALVAVLGLVRKGTWLSLVDLLVIWVTLAFGSGPGSWPARLVVCGLILLGWLVLIGWWLRGLRPYLRSLVPGALGRLMRSSDARWAVGGIAISVVCGAVALLWPAVGLSLVALGYLVQIVGSATSRRLAARHRRNAADDRSW